MANEIKKGKRVYKRYKKRALKGKKGYSVGAIRPFGTGATKSRVSKKTGMVKKQVGVFSSVAPKYKGAARTGRKTLIVKKRRVKTTKKKK